MSQPAAPLFHDFDRIFLQSAVRVGYANEQTFSAQVITATHRDLGQRIKAGEFRLDLYQRLAALRIVTPSLRAQLDAAPGDLALLVWRFAWQLARGEEAAARVLAADTLGYIEAKLSRYTWPGNVRELLHCVESIHHGSTFTLLELGDDGKPARSSVAPARSSAASPRSSEDWLRSLRLGRLTDEQAARRYRTIACVRAGSIEEGAKRLGLHRNTVARSIDRVLFSRLRQHRSR